MSPYEYQELGRAAVAAAIIGGGLCLLATLFWLAERALDEVVNVRFFRLDRDEPAWIMADWKREWQRRRRELGDRVGKVVGWIAGAAFYGLIAYLIVAAVL